MQTQGMQHQVGAVKWQGNLAGKALMGAITHLPF